MNANFNLQAGAHPGTDARRAAALRAYLRRLAPALTPDWAPSGGGDDVGSALLEIAARLGEETTRRLDHTARRDAMAFFEFLGLPPAPPRAAEGVLALTLAEDAAAAVVAPARTRAVAGEVTFETRDALRVVPGRIADLIAVDPSRDRIEVAPAQARSLEPPTGPLAHRVVTFAGPGSRTLQVSPVAGLAAGDLLRIGTAAHRIAAAGPDGLVTLLDPLEDAVAADAVVTRIGSFEAFGLRDLQNHAFLVGHKDLFKLEQRAEIALSLAPAGLARQLSRLDIDYALFGTRGGVRGWHDLDPLGVHGDEIRLAKSWAGAADEVEVGGRKNRWVRARLRSPIAGRAGLTSRASQVRLGVASLPGDAPPGQPPTIVRAAHNGTPLSTAGRFFPFGPEPLRFDTFALAAPEALSKKDADVTIEVSLSDASLACFDIAATTDAATLGGYGTGRNGYLEILALDEARGFRWQEMVAVDDKGRRVLLTGPATGVGLPGQGVDLVVAGEKDSGLWAGRIRRATGSTPAELEAGGWRTLPALNPKAPSARPAVLPAPAGAVGVTAVLADVAGGVLHALKVDDQGRPDPSGWQPIRGEDGPILGDQWQIVAVQGAQWPRRPDDARFELVVVDGKGAIWLGSVAMLSIFWQLVPRWHRFDDVDPAALDVRPAVTRFGGDGDLWVGYADAGERRLRGLVHTDHETRAELSGHRVAPGPLHANPTVPGVGGRPVTVGRAVSPHEASIWLGEEELLAVPLTGETPDARPQLLRPAAGKPPELAVTGVGERLFRTALDLPLVEVELHDAVELASPLVAHHVEVIAGPAAPTLVPLPAASRRIKQGDRRLYQIDHPLDVGTTLNFLRLPHPNARPYTATFPDADNRFVLRLDANDRTVVRPATTRLIIGDASYPIVGADARVVTLGVAVPGLEPSVGYRPAELLGTVEVADIHLRTLAELRTPTSIGPDTTLFFGAAAGPESQRIERRQPAGGSIWAQLSHRWVTAPPDRGVAALAGGPPPDPPVWTESRFNRGYQNPELSWEYFDGQGWRALEKRFIDLTGNLSTSGTITFGVPGDLATTDIGGQDDYWIRARLVGGDYGRPRYVVSREQVGAVEEQTVRVDTTGLHPPEILSVEASFTFEDRVPPEAVLVENNLDVRDETQAAATAAFTLFEGALALGPDAAGRALYVGLTAPIGRGVVTFLADAADRDGAGTLRVDQRAADGWRRVAVEDRTRALRRRGTITMSLGADPVLVRLFGRERVWLRLRPEPADAAWQPVLHRLLVNAVGVTHARTVLNEVVGSSLGEPGLTLQLAESPVLPASVELRIREELGDEEIATLAGQRPGEQVVVTGLERLPGSWVLWRRVDSLIGLDGGARAYLLDPASGRLRFGDGRAGRIPPAGRDNVRCFSYQQGGGEQGNLPAWTQLRLTSPVEGVETVLLPVGAAGGFRAPAADSLFASAPDRLRHAGQALSVADIEALAVTSSSEVVRARCFHPRGPGAPIRIVIAVRDGTPTLAQRDAVAAAIRAAGWGGLAPDERGIEVRGPVWIRVTVDAHLVAPADRLAEVEQRAKELLREPIANAGFGRWPTESDLLRALSRAPGLERVESVAISAAGGGVPRRMPADGLISAGDGDIGVSVVPSEVTP
ncbi:baseplate J/gp47 family protein [Actinoplanes sp. NPDC048796]|uniref:baseplate J/gp47 family protein n=1 Tax=Actinoplanes sp. NPDC048796 TaxID=3155640 RepID=UPI003400254E